MTDAAIDEEIEMDEPPLFEVLFDGKIVWVNGEDGCCIGRFGRRGFDIHHSAADQIALGQQCLACTHGVPDREAWALFRKMMEDFGATVPEQAAPHWHSASVETAAAE